MCFWLIFDEKYELQFVKDVFFLISLTSTFILRSLVVLYVLNMHISLFKRQINIIEHLPEEN